MDHFVLHIQGNDRHGIIPAAGRQLTYQPGHLDHVFIGRIDALHIHHAPDHKPQGDQRGQPQCHLGKQLHSDTSPATMKSPILCRNATILPQKYHSHKHKKAFRLIRAEGRGFRDYSATGASGTATIRPWP